MKRAGACPQLRTSSSGRFTVKRHDVLRPEAGVDLAQAEEAPHHQPGAGEQHERERDLADDERLAQAAGARTWSRRLPSLSVSCSGARRGNAGTRPKTMPVARDAAGEGEHVRRRRPRAAERPAGPRPAAPRCPTARAAGRARRRQREQQAFGEQLAHERAAAGAQRRADGDLASRAAARASSRLATLAQAMSSTNAPRPGVPQRAGRRRRGDPSADSIPATQFSPPQFPAGREPGARTASNRPRASCHAELPGFSRPRIPDTWSELPRVRRMTLGVHA